MAKSKTFTRIPKHVGLIPDGNRRWARQRGLHPAEGYAAGLQKGLVMLDECLDLGIEEVSVYGFTMDNTKRPRDQREAFAFACEKFVECAIERDINLRVIGDVASPMFPATLTRYAIERQGTGKLKVNLLVNYGWNWDLQTAVCAQAASDVKLPFQQFLASNDVGRIDLVVRWGGMRRLSGFLPIQSVYADFFVVDALWPDYEQEQFYEALRWFQAQDVTLGG
jgi:undecaprenyl diphosphate synthase